MAREREKRMGAAIFGGFIAGAVLGGAVGAIIGAWAGGTCTSIVMRERERHRNGRRPGSGPLPRVFARPVSPTDRAMAATGAALASEAAASAPPPPPPATPAIPTAEPPVPTAEARQADSRNGNGSSSGGGNLSFWSSVGGSSAGLRRLPTAVAVTPPELCPIVPRPDASGSFVSVPGVSDWVVAPFKADFDAVFAAYATTSAAHAAAGSGSGGGGGVVTAEAAREPLQGTGVPRSVLARVWDLADIDRDGCLDEEEFAVAMYLCQEFREKGKLPQHLPLAVVPPSKRGATSSNPFV